MNNKIKSISDQCLNEAGYVDHELFAIRLIEDCINSLGSQTDQATLRRKYGIEEPVLEGIGQYYPPPEQSGPKSQYTTKASFDELRINMVVVAHIPGMGD
jgi:hypothetical protein